MLAPTGIAAVNVGGQTMHFFFRIPFKPLLPDDPDFAVSRLRQRLKYPKALCKLIKNLDLIIIDEADEGTTSVLGEKLINKLKEACPDAK